MYRTAIVGLGRIAWLLEYDKLRVKPCTHIGGILKNKKLHLIAACDLEHQRLAAFGQKYKIDQLYTDFQQMLDSEKVDVLVVATWTDSHKDIVTAAARKKVRVIVCEKPMALHSRDCLTMVQACKKNNCHLIINHERRYDPLYRSLKKMLENKVIGKVRTVYANVLTSLYSNKKGFQIHRNSLLHDGTHLIDISLFLFGELSSVSGFTLKSRQDTVYGTLIFKKDIVLFLEAGGDRNYFNFELDIQGTAGRIRVGNGYQDLWLRRKSSRYSGFYELYPQKWPKIKRDNQFVKEYQEIIELLEGKKKRSLSSGEDGLKVLQIIEKMIRIK